MRWLVHSMVPTAQGFACIVPLCKGGKPCLRGVVVRAGEPMKAVARLSTKHLLAVHLAAIALTLLGTLVITSGRLCRGSSSGSDAATLAMPAVTASLAGPHREHQQHPPVPPPRSSGCDAPSLGLRSRRWAPLALSACSPTMPTHWAPCLVGGRKDPALSQAEELVYPDFSILEPAFALEEHAAWWRAQVVAQQAQQAQRGAQRAQRARFALRGSRALYLGQHGQTLLLRNVAFDTDKVADGCMARNASHRTFAQLPAGERPRWDRAVLASSAAAASSFSSGGSGAGLEHFLSHTAKLLVQAEGWRQLQGSRIMAGGGGAEPRSQLLADVWAELLQAGGKQQVLAAEAAGSAAELVLPCRCPRVHPFFPERLLELLGMPEPAPLAQRKTVLYLSQGASEGAGATTPNATQAASQVANEAAVLAAVREVLRERRRGEQLVVFSQAELPRLAQLLRFMSANVSAVVGPSSSALYAAAWFAPPDALILELLPKARFSTQVWEEGSLRGRRMWVLPCDAPSSSPPDMAASSGGAADSIEVPPALVARVLREQLGAPAPQDEPRLEYDWDLQQLL
ncbi:hypothetical protein ABPG75_005055 [Micractinium tetrahymenae]